MNNELSHKSTEEPYQVCIVNDELYWNVLFRDTTYISINDGLFKARGLNRMSGINGKVFVQDINPRYCKNH